MGVEFGEGVEEAVAEVDDVAVGAEDNAVEGVGYHHHRELPCLEGACYGAVDILTRGNVVRHPKAKRRIDSVGASR